MAMHWYCTIRKDTKSTRTKYTQPIGAILSQNCSHSATKRQGNSTLNETIGGDNGRKIRQRKQDQKQTLAFHLYGHHLHLKSILRVRDSLRGPNN